MNQIILASHGGLAAGARDTLSMVLGDVSNVHVVSLQRDDTEPITKEVQALIAGFDPADAVYVCTDMLGSSVNNSMVEFMNTEQGGVSMVLSSLRQAEPAHDSPARVTAGLRRYRKPAATPGTAPCRA